MKPETIENIRAACPGPLRFLYHEDRESPWLLSRLLKGPARIAEIRRAPYGKLIDRPALRPVVARCGGVLDPRQLALVGNPAAALAPGAPEVRDPAVRAGLDTALGGGLVHYPVTLDAWSEDRVADWRHAQMSRRGANLVLQVNFPEEHDAAFHACLGPRMRDEFEYHGHPISAGEPVTMAWVRIDFDRADGDALIEEVQSDWFRFAREWGRTQRKRTRRSRRTTPADEYLQEVMPVYERGWERVSLLAALMFLAGAGLRRVYLHETTAGARLKRIRWVKPPRSLYTDLPSRFCFEPTNDAPAFLMRDRGKAVRNLRRSGRPVFWRLTL
ncbi:MAG TPA: hypothetical protein VLA52_11965 [Thermohalobaculum sp.]|nr:hypothetical protein [Thermohalobaculum sp.]